MRPGWPVIDRWFDAIDTDLPRPEPAAGVDENNQACSTDVEGKLGCQLMTLEHLDPVHARVVDKAFGGVPTDAVIATQDVAVADHDDVLGHRTSSSSTAPDGESSWTCKAISPRACVEHDRHGS